MTTMKNYQFYITETVNVCSNACVYWILKLTELMKHSHSCQFSKKFKTHYNLYVEDAAPWTKKNIQIPIIAS